MQSQTTQAPLKNKKILRKKQKLTFGRKRGRRLNFLKKLDIAFTPRHSSRKIAFSGDCDCRANLPPEPRLAESQHLEFGGPWCVPSLPPTYCKNALSPARASELTLTLSHAAPLPQEPRAEMRFSPAPGPAQALNQHQSPLSLLLLSRTALTSFSNSPAGETSGPSVK